MLKAYTCLIYEWIGDAYISLNTIEVRVIHIKAFTSTCLKHKRIGDAYICLNTIEVGVIHVKGSRLSSSLLFATRFTEDLSVSATAQMLHLPRTALS